MLLHFVATCPLGLEELLAIELEALGVGGVAREHGAVRFQGSWEDCWRTNWRLRIANRVLVELASWSAPDDVQLALGIQNLLEGRAARGAERHYPDLEKLLIPGRTLLVHASCSASEVTDSRWAALKVKDGICDAQRTLHGHRSSVDRDRPDLPLRLRLHRNRATLLLDSSGEPLDRRGYRVESGGAPVRENLAAACLLAADWNGRGPVADPCCGTGTFLAEAGLVATGRPPRWRRREWGFQFFPGFDPDVWRDIRREPLPTPDPEVRLFGSDRDPAALRRAEVNLKAARLTERVRLERQFMSNWTPPQGRGLLVLNPPHDRRLAVDKNLWGDIDTLVSGAGRNWLTVVLCGPEPRWKGVRLKPDRVMDIRNGPLDGQIVVWRPRR